MPERRRLVRLQWAEKKTQRARATGISMQLRFGHYFSDNPGFWLAQTGYPENPVGDTLGGQKPSPPRRREVRHPWYTCLPCGDSRSVTPKLRRLSLGSSVIIYVDQQRLGSQQPLLRCA
jgi:hypothetical protein